MSIYAAVQTAPLDPILSLNESFHADNHAQKVNLAVGVYCDDAGQLPLMRAVQQAEQEQCAAQAAHGYLPISGMPSYCEAVKKLLFQQATDNVVTVQALGGTGALTIGADFLQTLFPGATVAVSQPTWQNHHAVFAAAGFSLTTYDYYDKATQTVDFAAMLTSLTALAEQSIVVLHACCHNPTGLDLSVEQWQQVIDVCQRQQLIPFLDMAYQGFAHGLTQDSAVIQQFKQTGLPLLVANSFSKSFSLYGERVGALSVVAQDEKEASAVLSQLKRLIRSNYSNPPSYGASIVSTVLGSQALRVLWEEELGEMRDRIKRMRQQLAAALANLCPQHDFSFINAQHGMFSFTGLSEAQVLQLREKHSIYAVGSGRICVAALTSSNVDYVAKAISEVLS